MKNIACLIAVSLLIGCGGGGGGESGGTPAVTSPGESLIGTYSLTGFQVNYSDGSSIHQDSISVTSWSGTMKIGSSTFSQSFLINGIPGGATGSAVIDWVTPGVSGVAHVTDLSGTHDIEFTVSGNDLTTYSGVVQVTSSLSFEEWDHWTKASDALAPVRDYGEGEPTPRGGGYWIGEMLTP